MMILVTYMKKQKEKLKRTNNMKYIHGIYLGACRASHPNHNIIYQDINGKRDIDGDMLEVNIEQYDFVIATPPCNWWSQANPYYWRSEYALKTRHLLPLILIRLAKKPKTIYSRMC